MAKVLYCGEVFRGCHERITGATEQEVMMLEAEHALRSHGLSQLGPDLQRRVNEKMRNRQPEVDELESQPHRYLSCGASRVDEAPPPHSTSL